MSTASIEESAARSAKSCRAFRSRTAVLCLTLLLLSCLVGAAALSDASTNYLDLVKILAVVSFIGAMVALALGMVGDSYHT